MTEDNLLAFWHGWRYGAGFFLVPQKFPWRDNPFFVNGMHAGHQARDAMVAEAEAAFGIRMYPAIGYGSESVQVQLERCGISYGDPGDGRCGP